MLTLAPRLKLTHTYTKPVDLPTADKIQNISEAIQDISYGLQLQCNIV